MIIMLTYFAGRVSVHETTEEGESLLSLACSAGYYELAQVSQPPVRLEPNQTTMWKLNWSSLAHLSTTSVGANSV